MDEFNAAFWKWFDNSKVVDSYGQPLVVYHGGAAVLSGAYSFARLGSGMTGIAPTAHWGAWFTNCEYLALTYGAAITPVYLRIKKPVKLAYDRFQQFNDYGQRYDAMEYIEKIKRKGYDGVISVGPDDQFDELEEPCRQYCVFTPEQIKAVGNDGTWDADDPDIRSNPSEAVVEVGGQQHMLKPMAAFYGWPGKVWTRMVTQDPYTWQAGALVLFYGELREAYVSSDISASDARRQVIRRVLGDLR